MSKGLRTLVKERLLKDVFDKAGAKSPGWKILVVDGRSMSVMSSCVGMYDIMERRITIVESLEKKRAPFPDKGVIYLLEPTEESIDMLMADYEKGKKMLYGPDVFLFFLQRLPDPLLEKIKFCRPMLKRLKALSEVNVDFLAKEERAFSFNMQSAFSAFYARQGGQAAEEDVANKLVTVCATLNEYPHIRYLKDSSICHSLAGLFHEKMDAFVAQNPDWWYYGGGKDAQSSSRERGVLVLMDRANDCLAPLMHDFHYQPMVHDLLNMTGDRITVDQEAADADKTEQKDILLDEKDELWVELRGMHIAKVIELLSAKIRDIMSSSAGGAFGGGGDKKMSLSDMAAAMKALPEYREVMSKLSQHMHISHECMGAFGKQNLMDLSEIEQTLATGVDDDNQTPKMSDLVDRMELALHKMKDQKSRLRLLCIASLGPEKLGHDDRNRLFDAADFARSDSQCLENLKVMGAVQAKKPEKEKSGSGGFLSGLRGKSSDDEGEEDESDVVESRYRPKIEKVLKGLAGESDPLSFDEYPSVLPMPEAANSGTAASARRKKKGEGSARKQGTGATKRWASSGSAAAKKGKQNTFTGGRIIAFTVGGMSYNEMTIARQIMEKEQREIIFGSTHFQSPKEFLDDLASLSS